MMPGAAALAINQVQLWNECNKMAIFGGAGVMRFSCHLTHGKKHKTNGTLPKNGMTHVNSPCRMALRLSGLRHYICLNMRKIANHSHFFSKNALFLARIFNSFIKSGRNEILPP